VDAVKETAPNAAPKTNQKSEDKMTLRIALSGAGYIANIHARAIDSLPKAEITALVDYRPEETLTFRQAHKIDAVFTTVDALVDSDAADALVICTPNALHAPQTLQALAGGLHVFVEKPMALNADQAQAMCRAAEEHGRNLMVGHCWRFDAEAQWLRQQVDDGKMGRIIRTKGYGIHANWGPAGWFKDKALSGGGALVDMGIHAIDTARYLMGDPLPTQVYADIGTYYIDAAVDDTGMVIIHWNNGAVSLIESGWWQPHMDGPEAGTGLYGSRGYGGLFPTLLEIPHREKAWVEKIDPGFAFPRQEHCPQAMYQQQMAHFIDTIQANQKPNPGGEEGWINMLILDAAYRSSRTGKVEDIQC